MPIKPDKKLKFWLVVVEGKAVPKQPRFSTKADAILEAERIASETFQYAYVMEAVNVAGPLEPATGSEVV